MAQKSKSVKKTSSVKTTTVRTVTDNTLRGKVTANVLNVRDTPSKVSTVISKIYKGEIVEISSTMTDWYEITYNNEKAYVVSEYIELVEDITLGKVTASSLNVRNQPNTESEVLGAVAKGETVEILKKYTDWYKINYKGKAAYVSKKYVDLVDNSVVQTTTTTTPTTPETTTTTATNKEYFYLRKDLADIKLAPDKVIDLPTEYKSKIAALTWNTYGNLIQTVCKELDIDEKAALAVLCVESGGAGFANDKMIIRFENHVFDIYWGKNNATEFAKYFDYKRSSRREEHKFREDEDGDWEDCHTSQAMEWKVFEFAKKLAEKEAIYSISLGAPQVMGFNYKIIGYSTPQEMFEYFNKDIRYHFLALFDFIQYKEERIQYLKDKDFYSFAKEYNGTTAPKAYEEMIEGFYTIFKKLL
jgi:uncharacterized protein YgiM (DUF1202 family)